MSDRRKTPGLPTKVPAAVLGSSTVPSPERVRDVPQALQNISLKLNELEDRMAFLQDRLEPLIRKDAEILSEPEPTSVAQNTEAPLVEVLLGLGQRIDNSVLKARWLGHQVEL